MADAKALDFYLDADDTYEAREMPTGIVKMGGKEYTVRCPKDSLPMLLNRLGTEVGKAEDLGAQEELIRQLVAASFEPDDVDEILARVVSPYERTLTVAFLVDTVQRVYEAYAPMLNEGYEEMGVESPLKKKPQDRQTSRKPGTRKAVAAKKTAAKKTAGRRAASA